MNDFLAGLITGGSIAIVAMVLAIVVAAAIGGRR